MSCGQRIAPELARILRQQRVQGKPLAVMNLEHLTSLTMLQLRRMNVRTQLPAGLRVLRLPNYCGVEPLVPGKLQHLKALHIGRCVSNASSFEEMTNALTGLRVLPQLRELRLGVHSKCREAEPLQLLEVFAELPLVGLRMSAANYPMSVDLVDGLSSLTKLTSLSLTSKGWRAAVVRALAATLRQQTALQKLYIDNADAFSWSCACCRVGQF